MRQTKKQIEEILMHKQAILDAYVHRLRPLELRAAQHGSSTPPEILNEIAELQEKIVICQAELHNAETLLFEANHGASELSLQSSDLVAVRISIDPWYKQAIANHRVIDRLLLEQQFEQSDAAFEALGVFLSNSLQDGMLIEVYSSKYQIQERVAFVEDFWAILIATYTIHKHVNETMWLIKKTVKYLEDKENNATTMALKTWKYIFRKYFTNNNIDSDASIPERILTAAVQGVGKRYDQLYLFFEFLYSNLELDRSSVRFIADYLERFAESVENEASPAFLERLKRLVGKGKKITIYGAGEIPSFSTKLVTITSAVYCGYSFQSMVHPVTNFEYISINGRLPKDLRENLADPYVFVINADSKDSPFNLLSSDALSIVELCSEDEKDNEYEWDIPTACEWLALAGCENQPYPWGSEPPTPQHANLDFGSKWKLRPVGSYPRGISPFGVHDCCGNVHEIIRFSRGDYFPDDFRLAGGCYRTKAKDASCNHFRFFRENKILMRRNVGLRLVRYRRSDSEERFRALNKFLANYAE